MSRPLRTAALLLALGSLAAGCSGLTGSASAEQGPDGLGKTDSPFWVDRHGPAAEQVRQWRDQGREQDAKAIERIAEQPVAIWPGGSGAAGAVRKVMRAAAEDRRTAVLVAYNIPHRDCGQHSAGGADSGAEYLSWIAEFARGIGDGKALVVLEPDAVPHNVDGCTPPEYHEERYQLLGAAIELLKEQPHTQVYLDAGNPAWIRDPARLADPLKRSGLARADGFALNVSNFQTDGTNLVYGHRLSKLTGGKHFVVDTSRNGRGPLAGRRGEAWCNPPGRALGKPPTTDTGDKLVDAYLWVKRPGESDGTCRGGPSAGTWWPDYALGLARGAQG
ncbi:glycoside hydrolase family 6 protein [Streptomyces sp. NA04227]|uniref:glycoside hydrolase family 6 protein n=1 Tax=Streptomyces sp. NA04227 TaxID=2742136 RepID=UPI001592821D|nr:glycoside hydrolase family 6 protein [Streptomyces sp. NA04227]QKW09237.1 glycoside hydrolase family 6 protein [Streptomyces sp. NA04227]